MEPPFKRPRLSGSSYPDIDLHARRAQNDFRLKSIFESIFDKYGRDFDGIGDEIDMETGEIVVNNGHILGMANERDAGDADYSSEELGNLNDEDEYSSIEYSEEHSAVLGPSKTGVAALTEESEASEQLEFDADSLMGDVPAESHPQQLGRISQGVVSIPSDNEEDELASNDVERASHSRDRLGAQERWCLRKDKPAFADEPAIEPTWRAPPLPKIPSVKWEREKVGLTSVDNMREFSDDERAGISLWTPEARKLPRRRRESANSISQQSLSFARCQENDGDVLFCDWSNSEPAAGKRVKWTQKEDELLIHLKTTTNLSGAAMDSYFPERNCKAIRNHWKYMINHGKVSSKPQVPKTLGGITPLPSLSPSKISLAPDGASPEPHDHDTSSRTQKMEIIQQQLDIGLPEARSLVRSLSKPIEQFGDNDTKYQYQFGNNHGIPNGYTGDELILVSDDVGTHIGCTVGELFSSARDFETKEDFTVEESLDGASEPSGRTSDQHYHPIGGVHNRGQQNSIYSDQEGMRRTKRTDLSEASARRTIDTALHVDGDGRIAESVYQANSNESYDDTHQSNHLSSLLEIEDDVVMHGERFASDLPDQGLEVVSENNRGVRVSSSITSIKAKLDSQGADLYSDGFVSSEIQPQSTITKDASNSLRQLRTSHSALQREESVPTTAENIMQKDMSTAEGPQKTELMKSFSINLAQPPRNCNSSATHEPNVEVTSKTLAKRQIVQVVIPFTATSNVKRKSGGTKRSTSSHTHTRSPLATTETADSTFVGQLSATAESAPAASAPVAPVQEILAICTPTRSPSFAAAESQYAASAAFALNDVGSSLSPEIPDSQPLSRTPAVATPVRELEREATRPIILDIEPQSLRMTPDAATSARKQPEKSTKTMNLNSNSQPLRITLGIATPGRKLIKEVRESDIVKCGSHSLSKTLAAARSPSKKVKREITSDSFLSLWTAIDDDSEDELSYL